MPAAPSSRFGLDRTATTSPRRLAILIGVGLALVLLALWTFSGDDAPAPPVAPPRLAAPAPVLPANTPVNIAAGAPPPAPAASASGLVLHGVMGFGADGAAIIAINGQQRLVRVGRDVLPGLPLREVAADHVIVIERGAPVRVAFPDAPLSSAPLSRAPAGSATVPAAAGGGREPSEAASRDRFRRETIEYQLGFEPRRVDGRIDGFTIRRGASMPLFARAGLRPGDVVLRVAGDPWRSTENIAELAEQIGYRQSVEIEFERDGQRRTVTVSRE